MLEINLDMGGMNRRVQTWVAGMDLVCEILLTCSVDRYPEQLKASSWGLACLCDSQPFQTALSSRSPPSLDCSLRFPPEAAHMLSWGLARGQEDCKGGPCLCEPDSESSESWKLGLESVWPLGMAL